MPVGPHLLIASASYLERRRCAFVGVSADVGKRHAPCREGWLSLHCRQTERGGRCLTIAAESPQRSGSLRMSGGGGQNRTDAPDGMAGAQRVVAALRGSVQPSGARKRAYPRSPRATFHETACKPAHDAHFSEQISRHGARLPV